MFCGDKRGLSWMLKEEPFGQAVRQVMWWELIERGSCNRNSNAIAKSGHDFSADLYDSRAR